MPDRNFLFPIFVSFALAMAGAASAQETVIYSFANTTGNVPEAGLILDKNGNLYGTTPIGGNVSLPACGGNGCGVVYEIVRNADGTWTDSTLYAFVGGGQDGAEPVSPLVLDARGHLFGMTYYGGTGPCTGGQFPGCGTVFELTPGSSGTWTEQVIYSFQAGSDGQFPSSNLILDAQGNLYGATIFGGGATNAECVEVNFASGCGTVFELSPNANGSWSENVLYRFQGTPDGFGPGGLVWNGRDTMFGVTFNGGLTECEHEGSADCGTVFELRRTPTGWLKSLPYHFHGGADGFAPFGNLIADASGNLYGITQYGGISSPRFGNGTAYELSPAAGGTWTKTLLYTFTGLLDGAYPWGGLTFDASGNLYGVTFGGGTIYQDEGSGTVFELTPSTSGEWTQTTIVSFQTIAGGFLPEGQLARDASGNFYGTTAYGGTSTACYDGCGTVFEVSP
jgi:hypothetical protein